MSRIRINDNPTKWFKASHPIRVADRVLNSHFGGTYMAYLALSAEEDSQPLDAYRDTLVEKIEAFVDKKKSEFAGMEKASASLLESIGKTSAENKAELLAILEDFGSEQSMNASFEEAAAWDELLLFLSREGQAGEVFKNPEVLNYIEKLQEHFLTTGVVGKSNSLADIVKTVHRELFLGEDEAFRIPDSSEAVAQTLITYQNSHRPQDLWHFVTPDYKTSSLWLQLRSGDNLDMSEVIEATEAFVAANPPPENISLRWFGQTYINVVWQGKMVSGMLTAFLGSFFVVLLMMILLFRSALWGILSMVPLTVTIVFIYGAIGFIGKDYDMPVAVLSSLSLGLAIDYAIHFLARSREITAREGTWAGGVKKVFGEPARAITRNVVVVGVGFLPLLFAPLVPYQTVGVFIAAILVTAGVASLLILPSLITMLERWLFPETEGVKLTCKCGTCVVTAVAAVGFLALNIREFLALGWTTMSWVSAAALLVALGFCCLMSRREACRLKNEDRR